MLRISDSQPGAICVPPGGVWQPGDHFGCHNWVSGLLLASSERRPGRLLSLLQCTEQPLQQRII